MFLISNVLFVALTLLIMRLFYNKACIKWLAKTVGETIEFQNRSLS